MIPYLIFRHQIGYFDFRAHLDCPLICEFSSKILGTWNLHNFAKLEDEM